MSKYLSLNGIFKCDFIPFILLVDFKMLELVIMVHAKENHISVKPVIFRTIYWGKYYNFTMLRIFAGCHT